MSTVEFMSHEEAIELLPWLVNDSLAARERDLVGGHARSCVICRRELGELEKLHAAVAKPLPAAAPSPNMRRINARIDAQLAVESRGRLFLARAREFFTSPWRVAAAVQAVLLLVLGGMIVWPQGETPPFTTLTSPAGLPEGDYIRAVFAPDLTSQELGSLLDARGLGIVAGPSARGVYTLGFVGTTTTEERMAIVTELKSEPQVLFAEALSGTAQ